MYYVAELSTRSIVADNKGTRLWDVCEERARHRAMALQMNNEGMQFAVVPLGNPGNSALHTLCVEHKNPLKIRV